MIKTPLLSFLIFLLLLGTPELVSSQNNLSAGFAKAKITNTESLVMVNGRMSQGVKEDIYARVLVLNDGNQRLVIITYDLNCLDVGTPMLRERLQNELGIPPEYVLLLATHNHSAPIQINTNNFEYGKWLADVMYEAVEEAIESEIEDVSLTQGNGMGHFVVSVGNAPVDYEIQLLTVNKDDRPLVMFFTQGVHPLQAAHNKIEAGHPGYAMDLIEDTFPGVQAIYSDASGGNQFVVHRSEYRKEMMNAMKVSIDSLERLMEKRARHVGGQLAEAVVEIYSQNSNVPIEGPISSTMDVLSLPLGQPLSKEEALKLIRDVPDDVGFEQYPHDHRSTNWVRMLLRYYENEIPIPTRTTDMVCTYDTYLIHKEDQEFLEKYDYSLNKKFPCIYNEVIVAQIGSMPIVAMQGEICAPIGARIKDHFRRDRPIMVTGYMGEHNLYIPTRELVRQNAYQAQTLQIQYASPVGWDPSVEDEMVNGVIDLINRKLGKEE